MSTSKIKLYLGPQQAGGPDNLEAVIVDFISGATKTLDIAIQELDNIAIAKAIIAARLRGIRVRVVLESDYLTQSKPIKEPFTPGGGNEQNRQIQAALLRSAINVKSDFNPAIFHQKFIVRDKKSLLTGSTNFTNYGLSTNLNHVVVIHDKDVAKLYTKEFAEIMSGRFGRNSEAHGPAPDTVMVDGIPIKVLFAPEHSPEMEVMKQMVRARERIGFAVFTFSQSSGIDDVMIALAKRGIKIRGAMEANQAGQRWAATEGLRAAGVGIWEIKQQKLANGNRLRKLHHKLMVIDSETVIAGSFNYTGPANKLNDENILVIKDESIARQALTEINRIIGQFGGTKE